MFKKVGMVKKTGTFKRTGIFVSIAAVLATQAAYAEDGHKLEEVTVTAEKREVNLQKAPLAVTAISGAALDKSNIVDMTGLNGRVPGMTIAKSSGFERIVSIRGIGSETPENAATTQPGVSFHVDGVYIANSISLDQTLYDVERIEVLRGPQGTVFGQSSTGGTINLITKQPKLGEFSGAADASFGNYNLARGRAQVNIPVSDTIAFRASVQKYQHDGFAKATAIPDYDLDNASDHGSKFALLWEPSDEFSALLSAQFYNSDQHGAAQKNILDPDDDPRRISQDFPSKFKLSNELLYANLKWSFPWATFKSITSYQYLDHKQQMDGDRLTYAIAGFYDDVLRWNTKLRSVTQEFNLSSVEGGDFDWIVGAFYMKQRSHQNVVELSGTDANPDLTINDNPTSFPYNLLYQNLGTYERSSWSPFAQATWHATDRLRFTAGARYNHDNYSTFNSTMYNFFGPPSNMEDSGGKTTGKLEVDFDILPSNMVYASYSHGYKPGGLNSNRNAIMVTNTFKPETVDAFELGSKNRFLDDTLSVNMAAFYYKYKNMQYLAVDPVPFQYGVDNIPKTNIWGAEMEMSYLTLQDRLRLDMNLTGLTGRFDGDYYTLDAKTVADAQAVAATLGYFGPYDPRTQALVASSALNTNGNKPPKLPRLAGSLSAAYTMDIGASSLTSRVEYVYRSEYQYRVFNNGNLDTVPSYGVWNLHFEFTPPQDQWKISLAITNLADKDGVNARYTDPYGTGQTSQEYIAPRQVIGTVGYTF